MSSDDLDSIAETSLMLAGAALDRFRSRRHQVDLAEARLQADQGCQALLILQRRHGWSEGTEP